MSQVDGGGQTLSSTFPLQDVITTLSPPPSNEKSKVTQTERDGLGRVTSVCPILSTGGSACGQVSGGSGILTAFAYFTGAGSSTVAATRGVQTRSTVKDALGRTIATTDPEVQQSTGGNTTTTYVYDSFSNPTACNMNTQPGRLILIYDPIVNEKCFVYDSVGRMTDMVENLYDGSNVVCTRFRFDTASNGIFTAPGTIANSAGRLVEAETDDCTSYPATGTHRLSDEWFSYDNMGNITDVWESTAHSGGYFHSTATYFANGQFATLGIPMVGTATYSLDASGRPTTTKVGTLTLVSGVTYGPTGVTSINIGSGTDKDTYTYDPTTGRMATYSLTGGGKTNAGVLTWNTNGTLLKNVITDGWNSADSSTCTYTYDDLKRIVGANCGTPFAQTYSYDQYNNLNHFGSDPFTFTYNPANNHYSTSGVTYDHVGRLTYDGTNYYTWNASGKMATYTQAGTTCATGGDQNCITYDAFGRQTEYYSGGYYQMTYGPSGNIGLISGGVSGSLWYGYIPVAGGGRAMTWAGTFYFVHKDWLGSGRLDTTVPASGTSALYYDRQFSPYGQDYGNSGPGAWGLTFTGDTQDAAGDLYDTPNRELNRLQGRWLSPDPARSGWNQYGYSTNPNSFVDPTGLFLNPYGDPGNPSSVVGPAFAVSCAQRNGRLYCLDSTDDGTAGMGFPNAVTVDASSLGGGGFDFGFGGDSCDSDFLPCGLPTPTLGQSIWSDVLGLPTGLNCPQTGGIFGSLCGGVNPAMDVDPANNSRPCTAADYEKDADAQANAIDHAQGTFVNTALTKWAYASSTPIIWGCLKGGPLGCIAGLDLATLGQPAIISGAIIWGSRDAYREAFTNPTKYTPLNCRS